MVISKVELCDRDSCTGCEACRNICPQDGIKMVVNSDGFLYPEIDDNECTRCNRCRNSCPILTDIPSSFQRKENPKTYACWINNDEIRRQSSEVIAVAVIKHRKHL